MLASQRAHYEHIISFLKEYNLPAHFATNRTGRKHESSRKLRGRGYLRYPLPLNFRDDFWKKKEAQQRKGEWKESPKGCRRDRFFLPNQVGLFSQDTWRQEDLPLGTSRAR